MILLDDFAKNISVSQAFVKAQKTRAYFKRYQVKFKRRRGERCHDFVVPLCRCFNSSLLLYDGNLCPF